MSARYFTRKPALFILIAVLAVVVLTCGLLAVAPGTHPGNALAAAAAPHVVSVSPADGAKNCPIAQIIKVTFDQDMDVSTITNATFYFKGEGGFPMPATVSYDAATKTATLIPLAKLVAGETYYITLTQSVKSTAGLSVPGAPLIWTFHTVQAIPPRVTSKTPVDGSVNCSVNQVISITFDSDMDASKFTQFSFYFAKRGGAVLPASISYDTATRTATLTPASPLQEATTYDVTLIGTAGGINGMYVLGAPILWSFTTVLSQPPSVASKTPADGAKDQELDVVTLVTFDRAVDPNTITADSFYLQKVDGDRVATIMTRNELGASLTPKVELESNTTYRVTLTGDVKNAKGLGLLNAPVSWTFTTKKITSPFSDVPASYRYFTAIFNLAHRGVIGGFSNGTFLPSSPVYRQQFAKLLVKAAGFTVTGSEVCPFTDVSKQPTGSDPFYPAKYVAVCASRDIIQGKTATLFDPFANVTRFQAVTMIVRTIDSINRGLLKTPSDTYQSTWNPALSPTHGQNARLAEFNGLLAGLPLPELDPLLPMTRGEIAQLEWNLVQFLAK